MTGTVQIKHSLNKDRDHIAYLDGWRGMAIALVLAAHFAGNRFMNIGQFGVDVFFVLSGTLMSGILFVKRTPLATFYQRRISRIIPVFLLYTISAFIFSRYVMKSGFGFRELASTLSFFRTYYPSNPHIWSTMSPISHLWSLNVEEHCYVILSLFVALSFTSRTRIGWILCILGAAFIGMNVFYLYHPNLAAPEFQIRTECAGAYVMLSAGYLLLRDRFKSGVRPWMPPAAFLVAASFYSYDAPKWTMYLTPVLLAFSVNHLSEASRFVRQFLSLAPLKLMGLWSFSIYLWQQPFYEYKEYFYSPVFAFMAAMIAGVSSFYLFEKPIRDGLNRRYSRAATSIAVPYAAVAD